MTGWMERAACAGQPSDMFIAREDGWLPRRWRDAIVVCLSCPVMQQCRQYAINAGERDGIWGGMTPDMLERQRELADRQDVA